MLKAMVLQRAGHDLVTEQSTSFMEGMHVGEWLHREG